MKLSERILTRLASEKIGEKIVVAGWVNTRRDHGGVIFVDLRDHAGILQVVFNPENREIFAEAEKLRDEFCVMIFGEIRERGAGLENPNIETGKVELVAEKLEVLNKSEVLPISTRDEAQKSSEESRLKYRFLDLRRNSMQKMILRRSEFNQKIREFMARRDFTEVATPILANSSPEGARDFLIPSRLHEGKFYALPQAPQQFKQLLMVGGLAKYYQIAACFRDEDPRADRLYGEFYQLDLEMSFVSDGEEVRKEVEPLIVDLVENFGAKKLLYKEIPRISYVEAMEKYGTDKPDLRYKMELIDLSEILQNTEFKVFQVPCVKAIKVENGADLSRAQIDKFTEIAKENGAGGLAYLIYKDGEIKSPIAKFLSDNELSEITKKTEAKDGDAVFFAADDRKKVNKILGELRIKFADFYNLKNPDEIALAWIVDFPFYEKDENSGEIDFGHNPFSMPKANLEELKAAENSDEKRLKIVADQYDMVMNGYEICSGGVRNHSPEIMYQVFALVGFDKSYVEEKFGAMLSAFKFGAPPHAGCAFGLDRIFMILQGTENIRDVVAFPKNGQGVDLMMNSPSDVFPAQLRELHIKQNFANKKNNS